MLLKSPFFKTSLTLIILFLLSSCQGDTFLKSEKKIAKLLEHKWDLGLSASNQQREEWTFTGDKIIIINFDNAGNIALTDTGSYSFDLGFSKDRMRVSGFEGSRITFNSTWQFIELTDKFLTIAHNSDNKSGLVLKEFRRLD